MCMNQAVLRPSFLGKVKSEVVKLLDQLVLVQRVI